MLSGPVFADISYQFRLVGSRGSCSDKARRKHGHKLQIWE